MTGPEPHGADDAELSAERDRLARASVLVLGDATLQRHVHGGFEDGAGSSFLLGREESEPGGGAGIVRALASFGVATAFVCVLGDDLAGAELTALVGAQANVEPWLLVDGAISTTTETRYVEADRVILHTMREDRRAMPGRMRERMLRIAGDAMMATSLTVLSDRGHGTLDLETTTAMLATARQNGRRVVADIAAVDGIVARFRGVDAMLGLSRDHAELSETATRLRQEAEIGAAILFVPGRSVALSDRDGCVRLDLEDGAHDYEAFVAAFVAAMAIGRAPRRAIDIARHATRPEALP